MSVRYTGCPTCGQPWPTEPGDVQVTDEMVTAADDALQGEGVCAHDVSPGDIRLALTAALKAQRSAS